MDLTLVLSLVSAAVVAVLLGIVLLRAGKKKEKQQVAPEARNAPRPVGPRGRRRLVQHRAQLEAVEGGGSEDEEEAQARPAVKIEVPEGAKIGAKKMAKLQAKQERRIQREAEERDREEKKKLAEAAEEERKKQKEAEEELEKQREEEERKMREERERREQEEYEAMKATFVIEQEGFDEGVDEKAEENLLQEFIAYIKNNKVVVLEDLAAHFKLKTQNVIDRIDDLQKAGTLTGVVDDRGKFIYISQEELEEVAKFIRRRGRVSIAELVENSNSFINLTPVSKETPIS
ncbi:unnamed protein product [Bemisia tabaci]|uniref:DDRGK domain-containing protein 1 n=1 Tax=Bemisia tabaci TaxID=7038 RepID=A0A9P0F504_BEMTA|nr:unnamed protein product [Bemisia tabaci]